MTATDLPADPSSTPRRRRWLWSLLVVPAGLAGAIWWFTAPLDDSPTDPPEHPADSDVPPPRKPVAAETPLVWPEGKLTGDAAKKLLLAVTARAADRLSRVETYTATLRKQELMGGKLGAEQTLAMKVRNRPFAIYLKFLSVHPGKEVVYAEGHHDNKVIAHNGDWTRKLIPRLAVAPDSALALADSRHPVTEAGLVHLINKLLNFRKMDMGDPDAQTILDRTTDPDGKVWLRSIHTHSLADGSRPFARVEVLYDPVTHYPLRISNYDWPRPGQTGELQLAERYAYDDLKLNAPLTQTDFDPANPDYAFMRF
jgi:Protein of unknown function (DUF1571)